MQYLNETGFPSVTKILSPFVDSKWFKPEHAKRGEKVHGAISSRLRGLFVPSLPPAWKPYYDSFLPFFEHIDKVLLVEERLSDEDEGFCGQPDLVAQMDNTYNNAIALIDWKTSIAKAKWWKPQLGGYSKLLMNKTEFVPSIAISARVRKDPDKKILLDIYDARDIVEFMKLFEAAHLCYKQLT